MNSKFSKQRRDLLKGTCTLAGASAVVAIGGTKAFAFGANQPKGVPLAGDPLIYKDGDKKGKPVAVADVVKDAPAIMVVAQDPATGKPREKGGDSDKASVLLYRVSPDKISAGTAATGIVDGIVCYSAVCTHLGCMLEDWHAETREPICPCHDALFDLLDEGKNTGGATSRSLPQIPIKAVNGNLVVAGWPTGWVGVKRGR
jgi:rieske iron-sulfur protein